MKKVISFTILVIVLGGLIWGFVWFTKKPSGEEAAQNKIMDIFSFDGGLNKQTSSSELFVDSKTLALRKKFGEEPIISIKTDYGDVGVKNFYRDAEFILDDGHATIKRTEKYSLTYIAIKKSFQITVYDENIVETAKTGEAELLKILGIAPQALCKFDPVVFVDKGYDPKNEYVNSFPLSFCPPR